MWVVVVGVVKVRQVRDLPVGKQEAVGQVLIRHGPRCTVYLFRHPLARRWAPQSP